MNKNKQNMTLVERLIFESNGEIDFLKLSKNLKIGKKKLERILKGEEKKIKEEELMKIKKEVVLPQGVIKYYDIKMSKQRKEANELASLTSGYITIEFRKNRVITKNSIPLRLDKYN